MSWVDGASTSAPRGMPGTSRTGHQSVRRHSGPATTRRCGAPPDWPVNLYPVGGAAAHGPSQHADKRVGATGTTESRRELSDRWRPGHPVSPGDGIAVRVFSFAVSVWVVSGCAPADSTPADTASWGMLFDAQSFDDVGGGTFCTWLCPIMATQECESKPTEFECLLRCEPLVEFGPCDDRAKPWRDCIETQPEFTCLDGVLDPHGTHCSVPFEPLADCIRESGG